MKKFGKIIVLLLALTLLFATFTACNKNGGADDGDNNGVTDVTEEEKKPAIKLGASLVSLTLGEKYVLSVSYVNTQKDAGKALTFSSADTSVVRVDGDGNVEAYGKGTAKVTATYDGLTADCEFTVTDNGILPVLELSGGKQDKYRITKGSSFLLSPYISFNSKDFDDGSFSYDIEDESVLEISESGEVSAKKKGVTEVDVTAEWRGYTGDTLKTTLVFEIENDVRFSINGKDFAPDIELYTVDMSAGNSMATETAFVFSAIVNGDTVTSGIDFNIADTGIAAYAGNKISAVSFGTTKGKLSYTADGETYETEFNITVTRPVYTVDEPIDYFSAVKGVYLDSANNWQPGDLFGTVKHSADTSSDFVDAAQNGTALNVEGGKILGVKGELHSAADVTITAGSELIVYEIPLKVYGDIITDVTDLDRFNRGKHSAPLIGYFIMVKDVTAEYNAVSPKSVTEAGLDHWGMTETNYFMGTYDGQGHSITNYVDGGNTNTSIGLFGAIANGSEIKNFSLTASKASMGRLLAVAAGDNVTIENVSLKVTQSVAEQPLGAIARTVGKNFKLNNIVLDMPTSAAWTKEEADKVNSNSGPRGLLFGGNAKNWYGNVSTVTNVYVFGNFPIIIGYQAHGYGYASNETDTTWAYTFMDGGAAYRFGGVKRYDTAAGMTADAGNDLSSFDNGYWGVENGIPVWGSDRADYTVTADGRTIAAGDSFDAVPGTEYTVTLKQFAEVPNFTLMSSDESAVSVSGKTFTLADVGKRASVSVKVGDNTVCTFEVGLARESVTVNENADFSVFHGKIVSASNTDWFGAEDYDILEASLNGVPLNIANGKIADGISSVWKRTNMSIGTSRVSSGAPESVGKLGGDLVIKTAERIVTFKSVYAYDGVIINGEQFKEIFDIDAENKVSRGFYVLGANIDMSGITLDHALMNNPRDAWQIPNANPNNRHNDTSGFQGVFDGRGYTISNFTAKSGGLFGTFCYTAENYAFGGDHGDMYDQLAVIRNVAVVNADVSNGPVFAKGAGTYESYMFNAGRLSIIENVYVSYSESCTALRGLILHYRPAIGMKNVIVDASKVPASVISDAEPLKDSDSRQDGDLLRGNGTLFGSVGFINVAISKNKLNAADYTEKCFENVYVISSDDLMLGKSAGSDDWKGTDYFCTVYAMNKAPQSLASFADNTVENIKADMSLATLTDRAFIFRTVYQYTAMTEMLTGADFKADAFTSDYWTIDGTSSISWNTKL